MKNFKLRTFWLSFGLLIFNASSCYCCSRACPILEWPSSQQEQEKKEKKQPEQIVQKSKLLKNLVFLEETKKQQLKESTKKDSNYPVIEFLHKSFGHMSF